MAEVHIRDLRKSYGVAQGVHSVNDDAADGKCVVIVGPSGYGKSKFFRIVAGLEGTSDTISIGDHVGIILPPAERNISLAFQNYALFPQDSVAANMDFALKIARMDKAEVEAQVEVESRAARAANAFVAGSPSMSLLGVVVRQTAVGSGFEVAEIAHPVSGNQTFADGQPVNSGIRPEHLDLGDIGIAVIEPTGSETHVVLCAGDLDLFALFRDRQALKVGDSVPLARQPHLVHLFDAATGGSI